MSGLVNYASSDEDDDIGSGKPAKVGDCEEGWTETCGYLLIRRHAKTENNASASGASQHDGMRLRAPHNGLPLTSQQQPPTRVQLRKDSSQCPILRSLKHL